MVYKLYMPGRNPVSPLPFPGSQNLSLFFSNNFCKIQHVRMFISIYTFIYIHVQEIKVPVSERHIALWCDRKYTIITVLVVKIQKEKRAGEIMTEIRVKDDTR